MKGEEGEISKEMEGREIYERRGGRDIKGDLEGKERYERKGKEGRDMKGEGRKGDI